MDYFEDYYNDSKMEELADKYEGYDDMDAETLLSEQSALERDLVESETNEETMDIREEIGYVEELRRRQTRKDPTEEQYPDLSDLSYDDLMDRGDRLLNDLVLGNLDEEEAKQKSEELRYIRMLASDYQRKSNLNRLLNLRDRVKKRELVERDDKRRLDLFRKWAKDNAGVLSAVLISSAAVIAGLVATARSMTWKLGDESRIINKKLDEMVKNQMNLPPIFLDIADGLELVGDNIWIILAGAIGVIFLIYELT
jgi:hypothetical protein